MQQPKFIKDSKAFNIFNGSVVRNWIPLFIQFMKLDTHTELTSYNGIVRKYVTNILITGINTLKLYVLF